MMVVVDDVNYGWCQWIAMVNDGSKWITSLSLQPSNQQSMQLPSQHHRSNHWSNQVTSNWMQVRLLCRSKKSMCAFSNVWPSFLLIYSIWYTIKVFYNNINGRNYWSLYSIDVQLKYFIITLMVVIIDLL